MNERSTVSALKKFDKIIGKVYHIFKDICRTEDGRIDYEKVSHVLFKMQQKCYISMEKFLGKCWSVGKEYKNNSWNILHELRVIAIMRSKSKDNDFEKIMLARKDGSTWGMLMAQPKLYSKEFAM